MKTIISEVNMSLDACPRLDAADKKISELEGIVTNNPKLQTEKKIEKPVTCETLSSNLKYK